jgi:hypothetical protein
VPKLTRFRRQPHCGRSIIQELSLLKISASVYLLSIIGRLNTERSH